MRGTLLTASVGALIVSSTALASIDVLFCQVAGHPKALVPAGSGLPGTTEFLLATTSGFDRPFASPDGSKIFFTGRAGAPAVAADDECFVLLDGSTATTVAREGTTIGSPDANFVGPGPQRMGVNNAGQFVFGYNTVSAAINDDYAVKFNGTSFVVAAQEGQTILAAPTEAYGSMIQSPHIMANGDVALVATVTFGTVPDANDDFCIAGNNVIIQMGDPVGAQTWSTFNTSDFWITSDGAHYMMLGDDNQAAATNRILVVDDVVRAREGVPLIGSSYVSNVSTTFGSAESVFCDDGSYLLRGHNVDGHDWVLRNGTVIAEKGGLVTASGTATWSDTAFADGFFFIAGNAIGDYVVGGLTNEPNAAIDAVLVLNGDTVAVREGDMIDLNGNGLSDDDAFVGIFNNDDGVLTDDLRLVFFANCVNGAGTSIGQMVLSIDLGVTPCPADTNGDGQVNVTDLLAVIGAWGRCGSPPCAADTNNDGQINVTDLLAVIGAWGACP